MFLSTSELEAGIDRIKSSPKDDGVVEKIVCRPAVGERRELDAAQLDVEMGLIGDNWAQRVFGKIGPNPDMQLNLMNARAIALIARSLERWQLAGDQFYVDLDLSPDNLPPGTQLMIGDAVIEVTAEPHLGCSKFIARFGRDAALFVNSDVGKSLNLRGINARIIQSGKVQSGSIITKVSRACGTGNVKPVLPAGAQPGRRVHPTL
jgi:MOSC domain-containing protein YiiM